MTSNTTESVADAAPLTINDIVGGFRARHIVSELDKKVSAATEQVLNNHATNGRKLVLAILGPSGAGKTKTVKRLLSEERFA